MEHWNLKDLYQAHLDDLNLCKTRDEILTCTSINYMEMRELALKILRTRKLTPGELTIFEMVC